MEEATNARTAASVVACRGGDRAAAEFLAIRASTLALRTTVALLRTRQGADDVAQEVAVDVLRSLDRLREPASFDAWVHTITVRRVRRVLMRESLTRRAEVPVALLSAAQEPASEDGAEATLAARLALAEAIAQLPARQRIALALRYVHDLADADIASALGCRVGTVHALLSRARSTLRDSPHLVQLAPTTSGGLSR